MIAILRVCTCFFLALLGVIVWQGSVNAYFGQGFSFNVAEVSESTLLLYMLYFLWRHDKQLAHLQGKSSVFDIDGDLTISPKGGFVC